MLLMLLCAVVLYCHWPPLLMIAQELLSIAT